MITRCPNCGHELLRPIQCGIKSCTKCRVFFEADTTNRLLGAAWELYKNPHMGYDQFQFITNLPEEEARFVYHQVSEECYSYDDFLKLVKEYTTLPA